MGGHSFPAVQGMSGASVYHRKRHMTMTAISRNPTRWRPFVAVATVCRGGRAVSGLGIDGRPPSRLAHEGALKALQGHADGTLEAGLVAGVY